MPILRKDPVIGRWVIISTERSKRPSLLVKASADEPTPFLEETCSICEDTEQPIFALYDSSDNKRWHVKVVPHKNHLFAIEEKLNRRGVGVYDVMNGVGAHEMIVESPEHKPNICDLPLEHINKILSVYMLRIADLEKDKKLKYVLVYKNYKHTFLSNHLHPRSNLIAFPINPRRVKEKLEGAKKHFANHERCIFCDIIYQEQALKERVVYENDKIIVLSAFAGRFPFEMLVLPKRHQAYFNRENADTIEQLSVALKTVLLKLKLLLDDPAYSFIIYSAPFKREKRGSYWSTLDMDFHWHIEIVPSLTKVAGFEWGTGFYINPMSPEDAAQLLKGVEVAI